MLPFELQSNETAIEVATDKNKNIMNEWEKIYLENRPKYNKEIKDFFSSIREKNEKIKTMAGEIVSDAVRFKSKFNDKNYGGIN